MQGLEIEKPEASHLQLRATIFSRVPAIPADEPKVMEAPPHLVSPPLRMNVSGVPPHPQDLSRAIDTCWLSPHQ